MVTTTFAPASTSTTNSTTVPVATTTAAARWGADFGDLPTIANFTDDELSPALPATSTCKARLSAKGGWNGPTVELHQFFDVAAVPFLSFASKGSAYRILVQFSNTPNAYFRQRDLQIVDLATTT